MHNFVTYSIRRHRPNSLGYVCPFRHPCKLRLALPPGQAAASWTVDENDLRAAFSVFDKDNDGKVTREEVFVVMKHFGEVLDEDALTAMIDEVDEDHDGVITYDEFKSVRHVCLS